MTISYKHLVKPSLHNGGECKGSGFYFILINHYSYSDYPAYDEKGSGIEVKDEDPGALNKGRGPREVRGYLRARKPRFRSH